MANAVHNLMANVRPIDPWQIVDPENDNTPFMTSHAAFAAAVAEAATIVPEPHVTPMAPSFNPATFAAAVVAAV